MMYRRALSMKFLHVVLGLTLIGCSNPTNPEGNVTPTLAGPCTGGEALTGYTLLPQTDGSTTLFFGGEKTNEKAYTTGDVTDLIYYDMLDYDLTAAMFLPHADRVPEGVWEPTQEQAAGDKVHLKRVNENLNGEWHSHYIEQEHIPFHTHTDVCHRGNSWFYRR